MKNRPRAWTSNCSSKIGTNKGVTMGNNCDLGKGREYLGRPPGFEPWPVINMLGGWASPEGPGMSPDVTMHRKTFETIRRIVTVWQRKM